MKIVLAVFQQTKHNMKFFDINQLGKYQDGTTDQSSGDADNVFTDNIDKTYNSSGQGTDGNTVILERKREQENTIDTIMVLNCNFANFRIFKAITSGGAYTDITSSAVLTISEDGLNRFYTFATPFSFFDMKFECDNTTPANNEKSCGAILGLLELGEINRFSSIEPKKEFLRKELKLEQGGVQTILKGAYWTYKIKTRYNTIQSEVDLINTIQNRAQEFFFWLNGNNEGNEQVKAEPYRFQDFFKAVATGSAKPRFYKNYLNKSFEDTFEFKQNLGIE